MESARLMQREKVEFNILCVVNAHNAPMGADLLRWFVRNGFPYVQFIPCVENDKPARVTTELLGDFLCDTFDYWAQEGFGKVSVRDFDAMLATKMGEAPPMCIYGPRCNHYIVIEHNGDVYPCDFFVYEEWKLGNIADAPLHSFMETEKYKQFAYQKDKVPVCRGCEFRSLCHGGCQKDRLATGTFSDATALCARLQAVLRPRPAATEQTGETREKTGTISGTVVRTKASPRAVDGEDTSLTESLAASIVSVPSMASSCGVLLAFQLPFPGRQLAYQERSHLGKEGVNGKRFSDEVDSRLRGPRDARWRLRDSRT